MLARQSNDDNHGEAEKKKRGMRKKSAEEMPGHADQDWFKMAAMGHHMHRGEIVNSFGPGRDRCGLVW